MVTDKLKELEAARAKLASLEQSVQSELSKELAHLPAQYGFSSTEAFLDAVRAAAGGGRGRRGRRGRPPGSKNAATAAAAPKAAASKAAASGGGRKRRTRAKITDETRAEVKKMVEGGKTGAEISKALGISLPSVQNIKKALGLVKGR